MAQRVGYFEDDVTFKEGPFVMVKADGWRVECEIKGAVCPALPDLTIYALLESEGWLAAKQADDGYAASRTDWLNMQVKNGRIVLHENGYWYAPEMVD